MDADLELLLTVVYCMTDDFLPERAANARRTITDAELITLCVAQAIMGIPSDRRFLAVAARRLGHLFPRLPERTAYHKRRLRLSGVIEALIAHFARERPSSAAAAPASPTRSPTPPTTATARATAATSGASGCTPCSHPTAPPERSP